MNNDDRALLSNLIDAFDHLYDQSCLTHDVEILLFATGKALTDHDFATAVNATAQALQDVLKSRKSELDRNYAALAVVQPLRERICSVIDW